MGREYRDIKISCTVSRHNSEQDIEDDFLFEELQRRIEAITKEHRYERISPSVF